MATYYISTTGDNADAGSEAAPWLTLEYASANIAAGDTVLIEDGTYEPAAVVAIAEAIIDTIWMSKSEDKSKVTVDFTVANAVLNGWELRKTNVAASKTTFKHLTMKQTAGGSGIGETALIYAAKSGGSIHGGVVIEDCDLYGTENGIRYAGPASVFKRCKFIWHDNGTGVTNRDALHGSQGGIDIDSCLFVHWKENAIDLGTSGAGVIIRNCTVIGHPTLAGTRGIITGGVVGAQVYSCAMYSYAAGASYNEGFRYGSTNVANVIKNCVAAGTYDTRTYTNCGAPTTFAQLEDQTDVDAAPPTGFGGKMFVDLAGGDYLPDTDGILYQRGYATSFPATDLNGNAFNNPPSIGCLEEEPAPGGGGTTNSVIKSMGGGFLSSPFTLTP